MIPFCEKEYSGHKPSGPRSKMCKESHQRSMTNFPPIAEYSRLTSPKAQHRGLHEDRTRREPPRPIAGALGSRPRSNSDQSMGDVWSSGRRSICSSNGRSSLSMSSGDASTVSTEKLWRRRKVSPRRVISRPVTPFPTEDIPNTPAAEADHEPRILAPSPPHTKASKPHQTDQPRGRTRFSLSQKHQPIAEEQSTGKITSLNRVMRKTEDCCLERKPHPPSQKQQKEAETTKASERRRRKSMPEIYGKPKGEARKADTASKKTGARGIGEIMDCVTRERIVNWLSEVSYAKDVTQEALQEELSCIDEE